MKRSTLQRIRDAQRRTECRDETVQRTGGAKKARVDFGLTLFAEAYAVPGVQYSRHDIAIWAGCTDAAIYLIELRAMQKLKRALYLRADAALREMLGELLERRREAPRREKV